ncbi:MAG: zf-HC2 domain-containing protein [Candidatus Limnocylindria bacterium]
MTRHAQIEELISASLAGDLTEVEQAQLEAHLRGCADCRSTMAAFTDQRRLVAGVRHVAPPRDLGARVRAGIASGAFAPLPWWRRPAAVFTGVAGAGALAAGVMLAIVLTNATPDDPQVGATDEAPTPSPTLSATPPPTLFLAPTPAPTVAPTALPAAETPPASPTPPPPAPEPDVFVALTGPADNLVPTVRDGDTGETLSELTAVSGPPVAAELSPDGQWLAYLTRVGERGTHEVWAVRITETPEPTSEDAPPPIDSDIPVGESILLGESVSGTAFVEHMDWSTSGRYLAYTLADPDSSAGTDVWIFEPALGEPYQLTGVGNAYTGSWVLGGGAGTSLLWVSLAGSEPASYLLSFHDDAGGPDLGLTDPAETHIAEAEGLFQPVLNGDGSAVIFWRGVMEAGDPEASVDWRFVQGGAPYIGEARSEGGEFGFAQDQPLFSDVTVERDGFTSAGIGWGADGNSYAVWNAQWTGISQSPDADRYPDERRIYFGHADDPRLLTRFHALDADDIPVDGVVVDVAIAPTGRDLAITVLYPVGGVLEAPDADLFLVRRNTGDVPDEVTTLAGGAAAEGWFGPAAYEGSEFGTSR